jgi:catechol 2,3-dioxygenase
MSDSSPDEPDGPHLVGHVHLKVRDVDRAVEFYTTVVGLDVTERSGSFTFLSFGDRHHDVALQGVGVDADPPGTGVGLYHTAFEVASGDALAGVYERLDSIDVPV